MAGSGAMRALWISVLVVAVAAAAAPHPTAVGHVAVGPSTDPPSSTRGPAPSFPDADDPAPAPLTGDDRSGAWFRDGGAGAPPSGGGGADDWLRDWLRQLVVTIPPQDIAMGLLTVTLTDLTCTGFRVDALRAAAGGLHSFLFPLNLSLLCSLRLNFPQVNLWVCPEGAQLKSSSKWSDVS